MNANKNRAERSVSSGDGSKRQSESGISSVAQIIGKLSVGGAERHFVNLINQLPITNRVAILISKEQSTTTLNDQLDKDVLLLHSTVRKRSALLDIFRLARTLRKLRCQVVHTHMFWPSLYGCIAARLAGIPVIVTTEHGENHWKKSVHRWLERYIISKIADRRFCVSQAILERRRDLDGVPESKLRIIANGTAVPEAPTKLWKHTEVVIGSVGRFVKQKDYSLFVELIAELRRRGHKVRGCIVGDGPEMQAIRETIERKGLYEVIELPGLDTEVGKWFRYFDIYAVTSSEEGLPVSLLEAMAYGLPIVTTDVGAIHTVVRNESDGLVVSERNVELFADAVAVLLSKREIAEGYARSARQRVVKRYSIAAITQHYQSSYEEILSNENS